jgi:DNA mismatch repair protein MutS2
MVTTHFDRIKAYGYLHPDVENVAVEFDEETLEPKYTLTYGSSGLSNAFLVAEKLGISGKVLEAARTHQDGSGEEMTRTLEAMEKLKREDGKRKTASLQDEGKKLGLSVRD